MRNALTEGCRWLTAVLMLALVFFLPVGAEEPKPSVACSRPEYLSPAENALLCSVNGEEAVRQSLGASEVLAPRLVQAVRRQQDLKARQWTEDPPSEKEIREVEAELVALLRKAPENPAIAGELGWFYEPWHWRLEHPSPALLDLIERSRDPARLVEKILGDRGYGPLFTRLILAARPKDAGLWERAAATGPPWRIAFLEEARRRLQKAPPETVARLEGALFWTEIEGGFAEEAAVRLRGLPPEIRDLIVEGARDPKAPLAGRFHDVIAVHLLAGDSQGAAALLAELPVPPMEPERIWLSRGPLKRPRRYQPSHELQARIFWRWLGVSQEDVFALLTDAVEEPGLATPLQQLLIARLAEREELPSVAAYAYDRAAAFIDSSKDATHENDRGLPARVAATAHRIAAAQAALQREWRERARTLRGAGSGPDASATLIPRLLAAPARFRFAERPLPGGLAPVEPSGEALAAMAAEWKGKLPAGFGLVRAERQGNRAAAVGISQDYDPTGEVSGGGYWVILSSDGGRTWSRPLYTGLRQNQPYVVREASALPLLAGDRLQVEAEIRDLDPNTLVFPPIGLRARRVAKGLVLDIPLAELERDSDGDGLTDLAEERLLTDPDDPDTDHDRLGDAADPMPGIPGIMSALSPASCTLEAVLERVSGADRAAILEGVREGQEAGCCSKGRPHLGSEKTLFFIGDRELFAGLRPTQRIVVLSPEEHKAAKEKLGLYFPMRVHVLFDRTGKRAVVIWSASWQGGRYRLEGSSGGAWEADEVSRWIT